MRYNSDFAHPTDGLLNLNMTGHFRKEIVRLEAREREMERELDIAKKGPRKEIQGNQRAQVCADYSLYNSLYNVVHLLAA